jgi:hypothetical protein
MYMYIDLSIDVDNVVRIIYCSFWDTRDYFIKPLTSFFDLSELANKQTNELRIKKYIRTHIAEMNICIDNTL